MVHHAYPVHYVELPKFKKEFSEIGTALDRWASFLSRAHRLDKDNLPETLREDDKILKAISAVDRMFNEEERLVYETRIQAFADVEGRIVSAFDAGREEGREEERLEFAAKLLDILDDAPIAMKTGLTELDVAALRMET